VVKEEDRQERGEVVEAERGETAKLRTENVLQYASGKASKS
jgi:hypothetical protein